MKIEIYRSNRVNDRYKMFKLVPILFAGSLSCYQCLSYDQENELLDSQKSYDAVNYHLFDNVQSDEIEPNMREAKRWFNEEVRHGSDDELKKALKLFISMDTVQ